MELSQCNSPDQVVRSLRHWAEHFAQTASKFDLEQPILDAGRPWRIIADHLAHTAMTIERKLSEPWR